MTVLSWRAAVARVKALVYVWRPDGDALAEFCWWWTPELAVCAVLVGIGTPWQSAALLAIALPATRMTVDRIWRAVVLEPRGTEQSSRRATRQAARDGGPNDERNERMAGGGESR